MNLKPLLKDSATLIIAAKTNFRTSAFNYKLLCLKRSPKSNFMPNVYVFPGGNSSDFDKSINWIEVFQKSGHDLSSFKTLYPEANIPTILQNGTNSSLPKYISLRITAIRETFEECGILICRSHKMTSNTEWASYIGGHEIFKWQHKVHSDPKEFYNLCLEYDIYPDLWALKNWSNWVTPPEYVTRFNTMFFLSTFYQMPDTHPDECEITTLEWKDPNEFIRQGSSNKISLAPPQFYEMSRLRHFCDIESLNRYANDRSIEGCETYCPYYVATEEGHYAIFPGDDLYPPDRDMNNTDVVKLEKLPPSKIKNRLFRGFNNDIKLIVENFVPKAKHLPPIPSKM